MITLLRRRLEERVNLERDLLVHAGPGAGKTFGTLLGYRAMKKEGKLSRIIIFCHRNSISNQWREASFKVGLKLDNWDSVSQKKENIDLIDGVVLTYQSASKNLEKLKEAISSWSSDSTIAIADEVHHLGIDPESPDQSEGQVWGKTFLELTAQFRLRIGLTGTPFRADNLAFCSARRVRLSTEFGVVEQIKPHICVEPRELIDSGDVRPLEFRFQDGWVEHSRESETYSEKSLLSTEDRESWRARNLRRAITLSDPSSIAVNVLVRAQKKLQQIRAADENAAGLVIAKDIQHARSITRWLEEDGARVDFVHSKDREACERLSAFQENNSDWLVSVDMCSEGFDAPRLRLVAYLTTVVTRSRFIQGITRTVRLSPGQASEENIPRNPSYIFSPADPLLMAYARSWSLSKPYLIQCNKNNLFNLNQSQGVLSAKASFEVINDRASEVIQLRSVDLPEFIQR